MLSEDTPVPTFNGPVLTISQIIKFVASSAAEAELAGLYICAKEMVPLRNSLIEMGWPQPKSPIQTDNTTALGVANKTIITKNEIQGHAPMVAPLLQVPGPVPLLLGTRTHQPCRLPYQISSGHLS
jgi:hypothetical protein